MNSIFKKIQQLETLPSTFTVLTDTLTQRLNYLVRWQGQTRGNTVSTVLP